MQTFNTLQLRQCVQQALPDPLCFVIKPVSAQLETWTLELADPASGRSRALVTHLNEPRRFRQINAAVRFIAQHAGREHRIEVDIS